MLKHRSKAWHRLLVVLTGATVPLCMGGAGFRVFLDLHEKVFPITQCLGVVIPSAGQVFLCT